MNALIAVLAVLPTALAAFAPCCAFGGSGGAVLLGAGVLDAFSPAPGTNGPPTGPAYAAPMAVGVSPSRSFATILFAAASGPEDARAGWIVTSNATNDVIFIFSNVSSTPTCSAGVGPRGSMAAEYSLCAGSGLFPDFLRDYRLASLSVGVFVQPNNSTTISVADADACVPVSLLGATSPFGTGAWSIGVESGVAAEPPATWSAPPSWCAGHWQEFAVTRGESGPAGVFDAPVRA
jgi:hypothetical protein